MRKIFGVLFFLLCFIDSAYSAGVVKVKTSKIIHADFYDEYSFVGECKKSASRDFYATKSGKITEISASEGNKVKSGAIILKIDGPLYEARYKASKHSFERNSTLFSKSLISSQIFESAKADFEAASKDYEDMIIKAPFEGRIGAVKYSVGDGVSMGDYLVSIISDGSAEILVYLPEKLMPSITKESKVQLLYQGHYIDDAKIEAISSYLNKESGSFLVKIAANDKYNFVHGSYTKVKFILNMHKGISAPEQSVMKDNNGSFVFVIDENNIANKRYVKLGSRVNDNIEITDGLNENDNIVTEGLTNIADKLAVEVIE